MDTTAQPIDARTAIPTSASVLGWLGVLPFAALSLLILAGPLPWQERAASALVDYGAIILALMGGVQWGVEMMREREAHEAEARGYVSSVLSALVAFAATLVEASGALLLLIAGFSGLLVYDLARVRSGWAPGWYAALRLRLSIAVVGLLSAAFFAAPFAASL